MIKSKEEKITNTCPQQHRPSWRYEAVLALIASASHLPWREVAGRRFGLRRVSGHRTEKILRWRQVARRRPRLWKLRQLLGCCLTSRLRWRASAWLGGRLGHDSKRPGGPRGSVQVIIERAALSRSRCRRHKPENWFLRWLQPFFWVFTFVILALVRLGYVHVLPDGVQLIRLGCRRFP